MKVKCTKILSPRPERKVLNESSWITLGKIYNVLSICNDKFGLSYYIVSDIQDDYGIYVEADEFEIVDNTIPSSWVIGKDSKQDYFEILPKLWDEYDSFLENLHDDDPEALRLFHQEVDKINNELK